jgi:hypothetical protein
MRYSSDKFSQSKTKIKTTSEVITQYSSIPLFHYSIGRLKAKSTLWGEFKVGLTGPIVFTLTRGGR